MRLSLHPAPMNDGTASALENATAGILAIQANGTVLTEGVPFGGKELQPGPLISAAFGRVKVPKTLQTDHLPKWTRKRRIRW